jgi:hypothetical protein
MEGEKIKASDEEKNQVMPRSSQQKSGWRVSKPSDVVVVSPVQQKPSLVDAGCCAVQPDMSSDRTRLLQTSSFLVEG